MASQKNNNFGDGILQSLKDSRRKTRYEQLKENSKINKEDWRYINDSKYDLLKNATILSGTIFASTIALSAGKQVNNFFLIGEAFLLSATLFGILFLSSQVNSREWRHFFFIKGEMEADLMMYRDIMEPFEVNTTEAMIKEYDKITKQKVFFHYLLRIIPIDTVPNLFYCSLVMGLILLWLSLLFD